VITAWCARPLVRTAVLFVLTCAASTIAHAAPVAAEQVVARHELTATDLEAFLDGLVPLQIEANDIAGATVAVVKNNQVLFIKGYGVADMKSRAPVTADTMFRIGSITKLFTWVSVLQLVQQGKLDLDADINLYLDFKIPPKFGKPITLRHLMTHRGGFQEAIKGLGAQNTGKPDLVHYIRNHRPDQIFEPGTVPSYSNYGTALAGYIVQRASGMPFETYVEEFIYDPLGMGHTTLRQPLPKELETYLSTGYRLASGEPVPFEVVSGYPAGSQSSSAADMAKFMLAQLDAGKLGNTQILKPETVALMHDTVTKVDPRQNGIALGFYETSRNGMRIISHGGDSIAFHSDLHLIPSEKLGFFVSYNSTGRGDTSPRSSLWRRFLDRYYPYAPPSAAAPVTGLGANEVSGSYLVTRRAETSVLKAFTDLAQAQVIAHDDGTIEVDQMIGVNGQPRRWAPVGDGVFRDVNGQDQLVFVLGPDGRLTMLSWAASVAIYQRVDFLQSSNFYLAVLGTASLMLILNLVLWPVAALIRWHYYTGLEWSAGAHLLRLGTMLASAGLLTLTLGMGAFFLPYLNDPWKLDASLDPTLHALQYAGIAGAAGTVFAIWNAAQSWSNPKRGFLGRVKETAVALSCLALIWFAWTMNLFDLSLRY
jgi:CubicO group peptidase (beta-lactamase class C family)